MNHDEFKANCASIQEELTKFDSHFEQAGDPAVEAEFAKIQGRIADAEQTASVNGWEPCDLDYSYDPTT